MKDIILEQLDSIEKTKNVKVVYACETGSRVWGFPSPDSDFDIRVIYKHDLDWYLSLSDKKDTIEYMSPDGQMDITGWDIKKSLKLIWKSNGAMLERLQSPIVYHDEDGIAALLRSYSEQCFSPIATMYHYLSMAKNTFSEFDGKDEVKLKKLFYALRATLACRWILEKDSVPPIVFTTMLDQLPIEQELKTRIVQLIELKSGKSEAYLHPAERDLNDFITSGIFTADRAFNTLPGRKQKDVDLDGVFRQIIKVD